MSTNLDKSLDEILAGRKSTRGGRRGAVGGIQKKRPQRAAAAKAAAAVTQNTSKAAAKSASTGTSSSAGDASKIIVSNLPYDVTEQMIKEYFSKVVGPVKSCSLSYGPNGQSRGIATISFHKAGDAEKAALSYNGVLVDKRPMKVELVLEPKAPGLETRVGAPNKVPQPSAPKGVQQAKPKPATSTPAKINASRGQAGRGGKVRGRGGRPGGRPKPKTAEELDAEMADYWDSSNATAIPTATETNGGQYANAAGTTDAMDDDQVM